LEVIFWDQQSLLSVSDLSSLEGFKSDSFDWYLVVDPYTYVDVERLAKRLLFWDSSSEVYGQDQGPLLISRASVRKISAQHCEYICLESLDKIPFSGLYDISRTSILTQAYDGYINWEDAFRKPVTFGNTSYADMKRLYNRKIVPKIIHQIWIGGWPLPQKYVPKVSQCKELFETAGYKYMFWTEIELRAISHLIPAMKTIDKLLSIGRVVESSDIIRISLLDEFGGCYIDTDTICLEPIDTLIQKMDENNKEFSVSYESRRSRANTLANGVLISAPYSESTYIINLYMAYILREYRNNLSNMPHAWITTGPGFLTDLYEQWKSWTEKWWILPSSISHPIHYDEMHNYHLNFSSIISYARQKGSFMIHLWSNGIIPYS